MKTKPLNKNMYTHSILRFGWFTRMSHKEDHKHEKIVISKNSEIDFF